VRRLADQATRRQKYGNSVLMQEPNIKNGCGGLRDYQNLIWMTFARYRTRSLLELEQREMINESERRHVFHLAGKRFSIDDSDWPGARKNQLVLIGKGLDHARLRRQLQACVARDAGKGFA